MKYSSARALVALRPKLRFMDVPLAQNRALATSLEQTLTQLIRNEPDTVSLLPDARSSAQIDSLVKRGDNEADLPKIKRSLEFEMLRIDC